MAHYLSEGHESDTVYEAPISEDVPRVTRARVATSHPPNIQVHGEPLEVAFEISTPHAIRGAALAFQVLNERGQAILNLWSFDSERAMCREPGAFALIARIPKVRLYLGKYSLTVHFAERSTGTEVRDVRRNLPLRSGDGHSARVSMEPGRGSLSRRCGLERVQEMSGIGIRSAFSKVSISG